MNGLKCLAFECEGVCAWVCVRGCVCVGVCVWVWVCGCGCACVVQSGRVGSAMCMCIYKRVEEWKYTSSASRQKGLSNRHLYTQLNPFALKLTTFVQVKTERERKRERESEREREKN